MLHLNATVNKSISIPRRCKNSSPGTLNHTSPDITYRQWIEATLPTFSNQRDSSPLTYWCCKETGLRLANSVYIRRIFPKIPVATPYYTVKYTESANPTKGRQYRFFLRTYVLVKFCNSLHAFGVDYHHGKLDYLVTSRFLIRGRLAVIFFETRGFEVEDDVKARGGCIRSYLPALVLLPCLSLVDQNKQLYFLFLPLTARRCDLRRQGAQGTAPSR